MSIEQLADITGPPRDGWGRYRLPTLDDPEVRVAYTRANTVAKAPEDQGGLMKWAQRMVVIGLGRRQDLHALAVTTDPEDKKALGQIARDAEEAGGSATGRNIGTAIHSAIEAVNRGDEPLPLYPDEVDAYRAALGAAGLTPVPELVERVVANTEHLIAGTFDVALRDANGNLYVADLKTGSVNYPAAMAIQLAIYATADQLVTRDYQSFEAMPKWSTERGIIIHLPPGGPCTLHWIDLTAGRRGLDIALSVRKWRSEAKAPALLTEIAAADGPTKHTAAVGVVGTVEVPTTSHPSPESAPGLARSGDGTGAGVGAPSAPDPDRLAWFSQRYDEVREATGPEAIRAAWPDDLPSPKHRDEWTPGQLDEAVRVIERVSNEAALPFGERDPQTTKLRRKPGASRSLATPAVAREARAAFDALPDDRRSLVLAWQSEGSTVGRRWVAPADKPSRWHVAVNTAAVLVAGHTDDDEIARAWIALVIGEDDCQRHPVGALLGSLSTTEAERLVDLAGHPTFAAALAAA